ncbi:MAG: hypothetical protein WCH99_02160 [Verrucomicrobiota bacterium]
MLLRVSEQAAQVVSFGWSRYAGSQLWQQFICLIYTVVEDDKSAGLISAGEVDLFDGAIRTKAGGRRAYPQAGIARNFAGPFDLLLDAGQIGGEEAFAPKKLAHGFAAVLRFQIKQELLLGAQITAFLFGTRDCGYVATANVCFPFLSRRGRHGSGRPSYYLHHASPLALVAY